MRGGKKKYHFPLCSRYNDFAELHDKLVSEHCVEKDILPPKKLIGNKCEAFVEKRRQSLEIYLNAVYNYLKKAMPRELAVFLDLHVYDIYFLLQSMALEFFTNGNTLLQNSSYKFNPVQVINLIYSLISVNLYYKDANAIPIYF